MVVRAFKSKDHHTAQGPVIAMSGASLALMMIALWGTSSTGLIFMATFAMTTCLAWQLASLARHRVGPLPGGSYAATDEMPAHETRDDQSDRRFGTSSRKPDRPRI